MPSPKLALRNDRHRGQGYGRRRATPISIAATNTPWTSFLDQIEIALGDEMVPKTIEAIVKAAKRQNRRWQGVHRAARRVRWCASARASAARGDLRPTPW